MKLTLTMKGPGGHTEAIFNRDEIRISFAKTDDKERGMIENLVERAKKEGMTLHSVDKEGDLKEISDDLLLDKIFKSKGELALTGTIEAVKKLALDLVEKEIIERSLVMEAQDDGTWKILKEKGSFKEKEGKEQGVTTSKIAGGG
jgi:hypothetical protein